MRPWFRFRLRTLIVAIAALSLPLTYVGSYYRLSRRGMRESSKHALDGFLYVSFKEAFAQGLSWHHCLIIFYSPLNWADRQFFGGEAPRNYII